MIMQSASKRSYTLIFDIVFLISVLIFYFYFACDRLTSQGIYCDVGLLGNKALGIYKNVHFEGVDFINLFHKSIPLMLLDYHGPIEIYLFLPALYMFGNTAFALHIVPVFFGGLTVIVFYILALLFYRSRLIAIALNVLLVSLPNFIAASRVGFYTGTLLMFFSLTSTLCFLLWMRKKLFFWLIIAVFFLGLGIGSRCNFWWFPVALLVFSFLFYKDPLHRIKALRMREKLVCLFTVSLGIFPMILSNLTGRFHTIRFFMKHLIISNDGISNLNYISNLHERIQHLIDILVGNVYTYTLTNNWVNSYILVFGVSVFLIGILYNRLLIKKKSNTALFFPIIISLLILLQSPLTPSGLGALHILYLLPFLLMSGATAILLFRGYLKIIFLSLFLIFTGTSFFINYYSLRYRQAHLCVHGGIEVRWNVVLDVLNWLKENNINKVGLGDTGIRDALSYLSGFQLDIADIFYADYLQIDKKSKEEILRKRLKKEKEGYYLFRPRALSQVQYFERFCSIAQEENKRVEVAREFTVEGAGNQTVFVLYRVTDIPSKESKI
jgi:hypothetical protein